jgi:hypothetical protein
MLAIISSSREELLYALDLRSSRLRVWRRSIEQWAHDDECPPGCNARLYSEPERITGNGTVPPAEKHLESASIPLPRGLQRDRLSFP